MYLYFRGIGDHGLLDPVEGINASVSLSMLFSSAAHPQLNGTPFAGSTLGYWWMSSLSLLLFGWNEFAVRFWSVCGGLGMAIAAALSVRQTSSRAAYYAALISATSLLSYFSSQLSSVHTLYSALVSFCMAAFACAPGNPRLYIAGHISSALAFIAYGPAGIILPWFALFLYSILIDDLTIFRKAFLNVFGLSFSVSVSLGYILFLYFKNPALLAFLRYIPSSTAPVSCFLALTAGFFPWLGYFISAILSALPRGEEEILNPEGPGLFILVWLGVFAFFGLFSGDGLLLTTCVPAMSALTGLFIDRVTAKDEIKKIQTATTINILLFAVFLAVAFPIILVFYPDFSYTLMSTLPWVFFSALFIFAIWQYAKKLQPLKLWRHAGLTAMLSLLPLAGAFDLYAEGTSVQSSGLFLRNNIKEESTLIQYAINSPSLYFYTGHNYLLVNGKILPELLGQKQFNDTDLHNHWKGKHRVFLLIDRAEQLQAPLPDEINNLWGTGRLFILSNKKSH